MKTLDTISGTAAAEIGRTLKRGLGRVSSVVVTINENGAFWRGGHFVSCAEMDQAAVCFRFRAGPRANRGLVILLPQDLEPAWWREGDRGEDLIRAGAFAKRHAVSLGRFLARGMLFDYLRPVCGSDAECFAMVRARLDPA